MYYVAIQQHKYNLVSWGCRIYRLNICSWVRLLQRVSCSPVGWDGRIQRLHLSRGVWFPQRVSCSPVGWGGSIHRLNLCRRVRLSKRVSWYDTKSYGGATAMWNTPLLPLLPGQLWPGVVAPDRVLSLGQIGLNSVLMLNWIIWNRSVYMYKMDLALDNLQWLIYHKT